MLSTPTTPPSLPIRLGRATCAAFAAIALFTSTPVSAQDFCEQDGLIVLQVESTAFAPQWADETNSTGYTGACFLRWAGADQFATPGVGTLSYTFNVEHAGTYNLRIRNRYSDPERNDCWTRFDGGTWTKTVSHTPNVWTWSTRYQLAEGTPTFDAAQYLNEGLHTFEISARSQDFRIDRVHLYLDTASDPQSINHPESSGGCEVATWTPAGFCAQDDLVVFQVESTPVAPGWISGTNSTGYTGSAFYEWAGGDQYDNPGQGVLAYDFTVDDPGRYELRIRSRNNNPVANLSDDCWTRIDGGPWRKTVSHVNLVWTWSTRYVLAPETPSIESYYDLSAGPHRFEISGRSQGFRIDRVHLYKAGASDPLSIYAPESPICQPAVGTWAHVGSGLAGSLGVPTLDGAGDQTDAAFTTITLAGALPSGSASLVIGASALNVPFKGGVLVPAPDVVLGGLPLDRDGALAFSFAWPTGLPSSIDLYWQAFVPDGGAPKGLAATNGLRSTTP
ncbi:MAG: hypothetical protein H6825_02755 [Planctomycetes bacterium]|nr:hypothetical protein [Planctomycetota bacterium]